MAEEVLPTMDEGKEAPTTPAPEKDDVQGLIETLGKLEINDPKQLENIHMASQQTGKAWNEVGDLRAKVTEMQGTINALQQRKPVDDPYDDSYSSQTLDGVDLRRVVRDEVMDGLKGFATKLQKEQAEAQQRYFKEVSAIKSDRDYGLVKDIYEKHLRNPEVSYRMQLGQTSQKEEYNNVVRGFYRNLALKSRDVLKGVIPGQTAPHMEQGGQTNAMIPDTNTEKEERIKNIKKAQETGDISSDQALDALIGNVLSDDDPVFR